MLFIKKDAVRTAQKTPAVPVIKSSRLTLCRETIASFYLRSTQNTHSVPALRRISAVT